MTTRECIGVSYHWPNDYLFNNLFRLTRNNTEKLRIPGHYFHKRSVMPNVFQSLHHRVLRKVFIEDSPYLPQIFAFFICEMSCFIGPYDDNFNQLARYVYTTEVCEY